MDGDWLMLIVVGGRQIKSNEISEPCLETEKWKKKVSFRAARFYFVHFKTNIFQFYVKELCLSVQPNR